MKRILITYQMKNEHESAEDCIVVRLPEKTVSDLLNDKVSRDVEIWLNQLAKLRGYKSARFCTAENHSYCDDE